MITSWPTGMIEVADGVFAYVQEGGGLCVANAGLIVGPESCVAIDSLFSPSMTRGFQEAARRVTDKPIRTLINTHHHIDHTLGNALFPEAKIIAHAIARREQERVGRSVLELLRPRIPELVAEAEDVELRFPDETFEGGETRLTVGEREARLLHLGPGHTMGDVLVYLPGDRLLFAGDVAFHYVTPLGLEGHLGNWAAVCDAVLEMDVERIVPGHGPVGGKEDLRAMQGYLRSVHGQARAAFDEGVPAEEASRRVDLGEYASWPEAERLPLNLNRCYQEFRGET